jgi:hypothetical protein
VLETQEYRGNCSDRDDLIAIESSVEYIVTQASMLQTLWGIDPHSVQQLLPPARTQAVRDGAGSPVPPQGDLVSSLGELLPGDYYFSEAGGSFVIDRNTLGSHFVDNLKDVRTFITHATNDCILDTSQIPIALATLPGIADVTVDASSIQVTYADPAIGVRTISFPSYAAGHMVSADQPAQLSADIGQFLGATR